MRNLVALPAAVCTPFLALPGYPGPTGAAVVEEQIKVPVRAVDIHEREIAQEIDVTLFFDDTAASPYPLLIINHGRATGQVRRKALGRIRLAPISTWFARMGFLVAVPTRIGYGSSGGPDVEESGPCKHKNYPPGYAASATQIFQVIEALRARPDAARDRSVVLGQSFAGMTAIALAARNPAGLQGVINFAGGGGGNPRTHPGQPCDQPQLLRLFTEYGRTARVPTLWLYTRNDRYWGTRHPRQWFDAFRAAGGIGEFEQFPPIDDHGHRLFDQAPEVWKPRVLQFLRTHGYPDLRPNENRN